MAGYKGEQLYEVGRPARTPVSLRDPPRPYRSRKTPQQPYAHDLRRCIRPSCKCRIATECGRTSRICH